MITTDRLLWKCSSPPLHARTLEIWARAGCGGEKCSTVAFMCKCLLNFLKEVSKRKKFLDFVQILNSEHWLMVHVVKLQVQITRVWNCQVILVNFFVTPFYEQANLKCRKETGLCSCWNVNSETFFWVAFDRVGKRYVGPVGPVERLDVIQIWNCYSR